MNWSIIYTSQGWSYGRFFDIVTSGTIGIVIGLIIGYVQSNRQSNDEKAKELDTSIGKSRRSGDDESPFDVLEGTLKLFHKRWIEEKAFVDIETQKRKKVVEYLSPKKLINSHFLSNRSSSHGKNNTASFSLYDTLENNINPNGRKLTRTESMLELFSTILKYSVDTSHPYFFNQLFGATDPVALASELVALSVNTSAYTYETAPVFTFIERDLIEFIAKIVYLKKSESDNNTIQFKYDGLMMPGGSLSNLTAIHCARHQYLSNYYRKYHQRRNRDNCHIIEEEKKYCHDSESENYSTLPTTDNNNIAELLPPPPELVAFISSESHYSFLKASAVAGIPRENIMTIQTKSNGEMDTEHLRKCIEEAKLQNKHPFFVAATSGSTVRGSFDPIEDIISVCRQEGADNRNYFDASDSFSTRGDIWVHVDAAWGGPVIFSKRKELRTLMTGVEKADSFTFNPHKMLGAPLQTSIFVSRHENILQSSNSTQAKYLFDSRKNGADYDLGDAAYTCGRRTDAVKFWSMLKYYGTIGIAKQIEQKVDILTYLVDRIRKHENFMLACDPWPFNVNFFYLTKRIKSRVRKLGITTDDDQVLLTGSVSSSSTSSTRTQKKNHKPIIILPDDLSDELAKVTVKLKLLMHESGVMLLPYQPLNDQRADCFRLVIAGQKQLNTNDIDHILSTIDKFGLTFD